MRSRLGGSGSRPPRPRPSPPRRLRAAPLRVALCQFCHVLSFCQFQQPAEPLSGHRQSRQCCQMWNLGLRNKLNTSVWYHDDHTFTRIRAASCNQRRTTSRVHSVTSLCPSVPPVDQELKIPITSKPQRTRQYYTGMRSRLYVKIPFWRLVLQL